MLVDEKSKKRGRRSKKSKRVKLQREEGGEEWRCRQLLIRNPRRREPKKQAVQRIEERRTPNGLLVA